MGIGVSLALAGQERKLACEECAYKAVQGGGKRQVLMTQDSSFAQIQNP